MTLSNKEREYRSKIIAENHFKKDAQRYLDRYVKSELHTYKKVYLNYGLLHSMLVRYNLNKLGSAMKDMGMSCVQAANAFQKLTTSLSTIHF